MIKKVIVGRTRKKTIRLCECCERQIVNREKHAIYCKTCGRFVALIKSKISNKWMRKVKVLEARIKLLMRHQK